MCREQLLVYEIMCLKTGETNIGCTQQFFGKRTQQHDSIVHELNRESQPMNNCFFKPSHNILLPCTFLKPAACSCLSEEVELNIWVPRYRRSKKEFAK